MTKSQSLINRLMNAPDLANVVPRLQPEVLHRVIQACGLEDCAEFVALATPGQLARILDLDVWGVRAPGADEELDADRFGTWIAVLMQAGATVAAEKLAGLDIELVIAGFARHAAVFDHAAVSSYATLDGEDVPGRELNRGPVSEIGGYTIEARRSSATWEAMVDLLAFLDAEHPGYFHRLMRGCVRWSNGLREEDGCDDLLENDDQEMFDLSCDREERRERQGYVTPAQARAFLRGARDVQLGADRPPLSPIALAYFRGIESTLATGREAPREAGRPVPEAETNAPPPLEPVVEILREAGVLAPQPRALPEEDRQTFPLALIRAHIASHPASAEELAYLTNAIMAGCSIQGRPFTAQEAADAAAAISNLGLENWPLHWLDHDLVTAFQVGWVVLHRDVCMYAAECLIDVLGGIRCSDREIQLQLEGLGRELIEGVRNREPWRARAALDVILMLDAASWAALLALIDECPVIHAALSASRQHRRTIDPTDFSFIAQNSQITAVREFMASLQSILAS